MLRSCEEGSRTWYLTRLYILDYHQAADVLSVRAQATKLECTSGQAKLMDGGHLRTTSWHNDSHTRFGLAWAEPSVVLRQ